jgi:CheY-like chemotaxis protein/nitrogen-specific signal transduction histidine kinase
MNPKPIDGECNLRLAGRPEPERLEQAQRLAESLIALAAGIAHDLSNALAPISMTLQLIREAGDTMEPSALGTIQAGAQRATAITRELASFRAAAAGTRFLFQPRHLVRETERLIRAGFPKSIQVTGACPNDLWLVTADPVQLQEVMLKLSLCAREAMPDGGRLTLRAANVELDAVSASRLGEAKPGRFVRLEVWHTGRSIPPAVLNRLYNPAAGVHGPAQNRAEQDLTTVFGILRGHGGFLALDCPAERDSAFQAFFPAAPDANTCRPDRVTAGPTCGAGQTILVVEDEPLVRNTVTNLLRRLGFHVLSAGDGVEALGLCTRHLADLQLLLTDLDLPHMSGLALLRTVRQMNSPITLMVMAGGYTEAQRAELAALNVAAVLTKPFALEELLAAFRQTLPAQSPPATCLAATTA